MLKNLFRSISRKQGPVMVARASQTAPAGLLDRLVVVDHRTAEEVLADQHARAASTAEAAPPAIAPERCCVHCGHALYAPPRMISVRCPKCFSEIHVRDITLTGDVEAPQTITAGKLTVSEDARVRGDLIACHIQIAGRVLGDVLASHSCRLLPTAKIAGRVLCRNLVIEPGAEIIGQVELVDRK